MSIESTLYSTLSADATVRGYVSSGSPLVHRIFPNVAPDGVADPYVVYDMMSYDSFNYVTGAPQAHRKIISIDCYANSYDTAKALAEACRAALVGIGHMVGGADEYFPETQQFLVSVDFAFIEGY